MFAGKTSFLIEEIKTKIKTSAEGNRIKVFKPMIDDRCSKDEIVSHDQQISCNFDFL